MQDDKGFMWFGTQFGLNRYDGYDFKVFAPDPTSTNSLSGGYIYSLFKDRSNTLWIGCNQSLDRYDPTTESFAHYRIASKESDGIPATVGRITQDQSGTLWLGTGSGLYGLDTATGRIIHHYTHDPVDSSSLSANDINSVRVDRSGKLLVADGGDLEQLDQTTGKVIWRLALPHLARILSWAQPTSFGTPRVSHPGILLWIDYTKNWQEGGLALLDLDASELTYYSFYDQNSGKTLLLSVNSMVEDGGSFWLGRQTVCSSSSQRLEKQSVTIITLTTQKAWMMTGSLHWNRIARETFGLAFTLESQIFSLLGSHHSPRFSARVSLVTL